MLPPMVLLLNDPDIFVSVHRYRQVSVEFAREQRQKLRIKTGCVVNWVSKFTATSVIINAVSIPAQPYLKLDFMQLNECPVCTVL